VFGRCARGEKALTRGWCFAAAGIRRYPAGCRQSASSTTPRSGARSGIAAHPCCKSPQTCSGRKAASSCSGTVRNPACLRRPSRRRNAPGSQFLPRCGCLVQSAVGHATASPLCGSPEAVERRTRYRSELPEAREDSAESPVSLRWLFTSRSARSEEHTSELQSRGHLVCRLLLEKKKNRSGRWRN